MKTIINIAKYALIPFVWIESMIETWLKVAVQEFNDKALAILVVIIFFAILIIAAITRGG